MNVIYLSISAVSFPLRLEYLTPLQATGLFALVALPIVLLGWRSLVGLGPVRRWVAVGVRLLVLLLLVLILGGVRWQRTNTVLEVMVLRDISQSTQQARNFPGKSLQTSLDDFLVDATKQDPDKKPADRIGVISFHNRALIDALPNTTLRLDAKAVRDGGNGTDVATAINLALATMNRDALHRLVLIWDGNATIGDLDTAVGAAVAQRVPIDVVPLSYDVKNEVLVERFVAPTWKRENDPYTIEVVLRSTNPRAVNGKLNVTHNGQLMDLDPFTDGDQPTRSVTLQPGLNVERVRVPAQSAGVHQFHATFEAPNVSADISKQDSTTAAAQGDTLLNNNSADAFTFVRGKGQVLLVDQSGDRDEHLRRALEAEGIQVNRERRDAGAFPNSIVELQNYDAIILVNIPRGAGGLSEEQQQMLSSYVHDMGGGLVMVGGPETFGAGGWQGSKLEEILPVNMDIPAKREIAKGALVLVMHSCEMPDGNYWGEQCGLKATEALSSGDEIGVISYGWQGGGSIWDYPLQVKGDGSQVKAAIKNMALGDMPSFDDSMDLALNGRNGSKGLKDSDARQKHVIIISDGDPGAPNPQLVQQYDQAKVTVSTITVYPHSGDPDGLPPVMKQIATRLKGRAYGPINNNPNQLPQIFIKEASVVRRSLIYEDRNGIPLKQDPAAAGEMTAGVSLPNLITGMVLTSRKSNSPLIQIPLLAGKENDPLLAHWQTGLGRAAVFTSDAMPVWTANLVSSSAYSKFWSQVVRGVSRAPMSADLDVQTSQVGDKARVTVEALKNDSAFLNFLSIRGTVVGPDMKPQDVRLVQTGPGTYEAEFVTGAAGNYVVVLNYRGAKGEGGMLLSGLAVNQSPETRELKSNDAVLQRIAEQTGGRVLKPFEPKTANLFSRQNVVTTASPQPIWDWLLPVLIALIIVDVAVRRIAWDMQMVRTGAKWLGDQVRVFTVTTRQAEPKQTLDALKRVREGVAEDRAKREQAGSVVPSPDRSRKFEAKGVEGDITQVVGGATNQPVSSSPKVEKPMDEPTGQMGSLLEAKRRARQKMREKES